MRIVAGSLGGRRLHAPPGRGTRPTADRVREALFSILGDVSGLAVLDLFAGSGALGIEALSRGATSATFVDSGTRAIAAVRRNLAELGLDAPVIRRDALAFLAAPARAPGAPYDLVFLDPPYSSADRLAGPLSERLPAVASGRGLIVSESDKRNPLELTLPLEDERTYGDTRIALHRVQ
ncbi:MAG TPA: 16S rRNA (guanine(966)-N(2))-methyltransferase RsmD [Thermoleophilaceae bacterium]